MAMFHMANDSGLFKARDWLERENWRLDGNASVRGGGRMLPLYEAKMVHHYDHRFSTYEGATQKQRNKGTLPRLTPGRHQDPVFPAQPGYWVAETAVAAKLAVKGWDRGWLLGWRDICRSRDERTVIAAAIPRAAIGHQMPLAFAVTGASLLQGNLSGPFRKSVGIRRPSHARRSRRRASVTDDLRICALGAPCERGAVPPSIRNDISVRDHLVPSFDYVARRKIAGTHLTYFYLKQLPVLPPETYQFRAPWGDGEDLASWVSARVLELSYTAYDMAPYARELGDSGPPFRWDAGRRELLRAELDAAFFHLYGIPREDVDHIMDSFRAFRNNDPDRFARTKALVLEIYDALAKATETGEPYQTILDPAPGQGPRHAPR